MSGAREERSARVRTLVLGLLLAALVVLSVLTAKPAHAATFTVNRTGDAGDRRISDSVCDSSRDRGKQCTLRAAIQESNDTLGADTINFNIVSNASVKTISPASPLPTIIEAVTMNGYSQRGARTNNVAEGNDAVLKIQLNGTNAGSGAEGIVITGAGSTIRGLAINRFDGRGIQFVGSGTTGNKIEGNFIGTNVAGTEALGNSDDGVFILSAPDNTVGGTSPSARNVISGNGFDGVKISIAGSTGNVILGNFIGTNAAGTGDLGNSDDGVEISSADNTIGGTASGARNVISGNDAGGIRIIGSGATGNSVLSNSIFANDDLGIDLGTSGVTANDTDDPDTGANNLQNFPVITSAIRFSTGFTTITGTLNSNPSQPFTIQCFVAAPDPSGHGEGQIPIGQTTADTDTGGDDSFACPVSPVPQPGQAVTATATNTATGDTSEFSLNQAVVAGP